MNKSKLYRFAAAYLFLSALLIFNSWFLYAKFQKVGEHEGLVTHTNQVMSELDLLRGAVVDMETGQRGFLILNDDSFLEPYYRGSGQVDKYLYNVENLTRDDPEQTSEFETLKKIVNKRTAHISRLLNSKTQHNISSEERKRLFEEGRALMRQLYEQVERMKGLENELLDKRTEDFNRARLYFIFLLIGTTALSLVALTVAARLTRVNQIRLEKDKEHGRRLADIQENLAVGSASVAGIQSPQQLADKTQSFLANRLKVLSSKLYLLSNGKLILLAKDSHAPAGTSSLVEEAVKRSELWWVQDVPQNYWKISSGLGEALPRHLIFLPLIFQGRKFGVLELALFADPDEDTREVLTKFAESLSISLSASLSREELQSLFERTQQQAEELEAQQEELRASNEELEQQTRALESQQESLNIKNTELEEIRDALEEKAKDLEMSSQYKSDFLAKMSHELRTPLNGLLILSTLLSENKEKNLTDQQKQFAASINSAGNDLLLLINDILDLSKIEARKLNLRPENFSLASLLESLHTAFHPQVDAKHLKFEIRLPENSPDIKLHTDRQRVEQILRNFLSNAIKFTEKGFVGLEAQLLNDSSVEIAVRDSGIGVAEAKRELIFQAFEQADTSVSRKYGGTGLGLTISRELAGLLGGEVSLESREGEGSRFALKIPLHLPSVAKPIPAPTETVVVEVKDKRDRTEKLREDQKKAQEILQNVPKSGRSILIVEDDKAFLASVSDAAKGYGFNVIPARDGEVAMAILEKYTPNAILLDIKLPGISGLGILEMVKQMPHLRHIPVHMISGLDYQHNALRLGALGYLTKPVTVEKIRSALERIEGLISSQVRHVLLIEDDDRQSEGIAGLVAGNDVAIDRVNSGEEALARLRDNAYDCVILDLSLPNMSGFEMLEQLNSLDISVPPIVIYTAKDLSEKEEEYLRRFSESIIIKGARSPERLLDEVNLFLHRVESLLPPEMRNMLSQLRAEKPDFANKTVLVVDDDLRNIFAMTSALEAKGLTVRIAKDGIEALEVLEFHPDIDLVLMDIMMPRLDGLETMRRIRKNPKPGIRELPLIALTAKAMREDHEKCIAAGANDYIPKPVDLRHLSTILKVWLSNKGLFA